MRALLLNAGVTEAECERLKPIYTPWFKGLRWSDLKKKRKVCLPPLFMSLISVVGNVCLGCSGDCRTRWENPLSPETTFANKCATNLPCSPHTSSQVCASSFYNVFYFPIRADKVYTKIWDTNTTLEQMEKVVRSVIEPTAEVSRAVEVYLAENA